MNKALEFNQGPYLRSRFKTVSSSLPPSPLRKPRPQSAYDLFNQGLAFEQKGETQRAIEAYAGAIALDPQYAGAHNNLGTIYYNTKQWKDAARHYDAALEIDPNYPLALFNRAHLYEDMGNAQQAINFYQRAIKIAPNYADAHYNLALLFKCCQKYADAIKHWNDFIRLTANPEDRWRKIAERERSHLLELCVGHEAKSQNVKEPTQRQINFYLETAYFYFGAVESVLNNNRPPDDFEKMNKKYVRVLKNNNVRHKGMETEPELLIKAAGFLCDLFLKHKPDSEPAIQLQQAIQASCSRLNGSTQNVSQSDPGKQHMPQKQGHGRAKVLVMPAGLDNSCSP